ncbi:hypothetical protein Aaphi23p09 [Haemophilus phage Aaphi23]|uniref:hypothetical protein n=1 Tax=Haemophilus phage Aaphi23 TaxID=230158 RepID=UPI00001A364D|nr:hypothetical protein Aaphi23p09 [Haemophilus phage Aaphi23]CAD90785.1 hypothetical protein [Haemophilus phage Aaphi23]
MEEYAKLLNAILTKVVFNRMTMFFVFLFVGFTFIPTELTLYLNAKTPAFFPDWFTLANFGSLVFGFVATMIWILSSNAIKSLINKTRCSIKANSEQAKLLELLPTLSGTEKEILALSCLGEQIWRDDFKTKIAIEKLLELKLISYGWVSNRYEVNPLIRPSLISELDKLANTHQ